MPGKQGPGTGEDQAVPFRTGQTETRGEAALPDHPATAGRKAAARLPAPLPTPRKCTSHIGFSLVARKHSSSGRKGVVVTLNSDSLKWAIQFIDRHSDGDIFPSIPEISAIKSQPEELIEALANKPLGNFRPQPCRRFIVPKDYLSYRQATQLHPQDSLLLAAAIYQFGEGIEERRLPQTWSSATDLIRFPNTVFMDLNHRGMTSGPRVSL